MNERSIQPIIETQIPEKPRLPQAEELEQRLFGERPDLAQLRSEVEGILNEETLDRERLERWVSTWNQKESTQRGFTSETLELSDAVAPHFRHGRLRYFLFPQTQAVKIGYKLNS